MHRVRIAVLSILFWLTAVASPAAQAQTLTVIHNFTGAQDGANPRATHIPSMNTERPAYLVHSSSPAAGRRAPVPSDNRRSGPWPSARPSAIPACAPFA